MKKVLISGSSGFVGTVLSQFFINKGYIVESINRNNLNDIPKLTEQMNDCEIVINLAGANIIAKWTESYKKILYESRINTTKSIVKAMQLCTKKPRLFISTSAVGIYSSHEENSEDNTNYENDFLSQLCQDWEKEAFKANELKIRTVIFRFGIVMGKGGALAKMLLPFKLGLGGIIGNGNQAFSYVHITDLQNAFWFLCINENLEGVFNLTAPFPTTNKGLTKALGNSLHRPTFLPLPEFVLRIIFSEGAKVLTSGQRVIPKRLVESGFTFQFDTIEKTVDDLV